MLTNNQGTRPNILAIMTDEHTAAITGCYGNSVVQTPNLDGLADRGITFDACYTPSPLCVPARLAFTAGQYISHIGAWSNTCNIMDENLVTLPAALNATGYETVLCGKMHYDRKRRYGFELDLVPGHNDKQMSGRGKRLAGSYSESPNLSNRFAHFRTDTNSSTMNYDMAVTQQAVEYLKSRHQVDPPFFMLAGYMAPHFPIVVPEAFWRNYQDRVPMPVIPAGFLESLPRNYRNLRAGFEMTDVPDDVVKLGRELYYGLVQWMDEQVGTLLATLEQSEVSDNTIVIYTADHGENMGEHGLWWKNAMYDQATRVPLIVSWPQRWQGGQRRLQCCSLLDLVRTLPELAGIPAPSSFDGRSMANWLDNASADWDDFAISEYYAHNISSGYAMIRKGHMKYVYHTPAEREFPAECELYDLETDPGEFKNLAYQDEYQSLIKQMHSLLVQELGEHPDITEMRCRQNTLVGYNKKLQDVV